jgi:hypothetical protein
MVLVFVWKLDFGGGEIIWKKILLYLKKMEEYKVC